MSLGDLGDRWAPVDWAIGKWNDRQVKGVRASALLPWNYDGVNFYVSVGNQSCSIMIDGFQMAKLRLEEIVPFVYDTLDKLYTACVEAIDGMDPVEGGR